MTNSATNIIRKQRFKIVAGSADQAMAYRAQMDDGWLERYTHALNQSISKLNIHPTHKLYIPKLQISIAALPTHFNSNQWMSELVYKLCQNINDAIAKQPFAHQEDLHALEAETEEPEQRNTNHQQGNLNTLAFQQYLLHGSLPAWCRHTGFHPEDWIQMQLQEDSNPTLLQWCFQWLTSVEPNQRTAVLQRLISVVPSQHFHVVASWFLKFSKQKHQSFLLPLLAWLSHQPTLSAQSKAVMLALLQSTLLIQIPWWQSFIAKCLELAPSSKFNTLQQSAIAQVWQAALAELAYQHGDSSLVDELRKFMPDVADQPALSQPVKAFTPNQHLDAPSPNPTAIYTQQAGIVVLHPFLPTLFSNCGLLNAEKQFESLAAQSNAVLLLRHLSGRASNDWELALEKRCCGLTEVDFIDVEMQVDNAHLQAANALLEAVLEYWPPLRQSSTVTLQETFLQRFGKLNTNEPNQWQLHIERMGVDVLLEQLPWSFSMIKFPWVKPLINVLW